MAQADGSVVGETRILLADDDDEIRKLLSRRLADRGYRVYAAADGMTALEQALVAKPQLVVLDVMMPGKNGWEVARALRQRKETSSSKILMLTAIGPKVNEVTSPIYGADDYLDKPFDFSTFEAKVVSLIGEPKRS